MSLNNDFWAALDKKKKKELEESNTIVTAGNDYTYEFLNALDTDSYNGENDDIAPVRDTSGYFQKSSGNFLETVGGTATDVAENVIEGRASWWERLIDGASMLGAAMNRTQTMKNADTEIMFNALTGNKKESASETVERYQGYADEVEKETMEFVGKNLINEEKIAKQIIDPVESTLGLDTEGAYSILGDKSDALVQSGADLLAREGLKHIPVVGQGVALATTGLTSLGGEAENAANSGLSATFKEAFLSGMNTAASEIGTEYLFGGFKFGGKTLTDGIVDKVASVFTNKALRTLAKWGINTVGEGAEEDLSGWLSAVGQKLTYADEKELEELYTNEDHWDNFLAGTILGGFGETVNVAKSKINKVDYVSGLTDNEEKVVKKVYEDAVAEREADGTKLSLTEKNKLRDSIVDNMNKGQLNVDDIESVLGGDAYKSYKDTIETEDALKKELATLRNIKKSDLTDIQDERLQELKGMNLDDTTKRTDLRKQLDDKVFNALQSDRGGKGSLLLETYRERERKGQSFEADLTQYKGKQKAAVERAINSGVLNNTYRSHELVDILSKIEADKGIVFDYTDNAKLKESGFAVEGKTVNGFEQNGTVTLNIQSSKSWQSVVGHEVTHILEGTEAYGELQSALFAYAESKGELASRKSQLTEWYKNLNADIDKELTADLVGDYLFNDTDFIRGLTENRNVFQKIYDEIKYLCKVATGKELTEIEKVKREFDKVWKEFSTKGINEELNEATDSEIDDVKYSVSVEDKKTLDFLNEQVSRGEYNAETNPDGGYYVTYKSMSYWGTDEDGNAILRSPMAEYVDGELSNAYLIPKDKSKLNWYQATETIDDKTGLPAGLMVKTKKPGNKSFTYLPAAENQDLIADDWSNLYFNLQKKVLKNGKWVKSDVPARYNPYEHSSNSMLNDQFSAAYLRDNLVTVKMYVPISEDNGAFRAKWSKDPTGWADWKTGTVAGKINKQKDLQRKVYLSRYAAPVEIVPDSEVAQAYKEYIDGTDVTIPDNVVSPNLLKELRNAGVPITESGKVKYSVSEDSNGNELSLAVQKRFANSKAVDENGNLKVLYHGTASGEFFTFDKSKGSVEGDFGSGFYFTDSEYDVEANYEDGGADFENKVARRAEQIEAEEEIDYHEAEARAREELYKGSYKHEVYLNIENPAIVGETNLFDYDSYAEQYDREDYDSDEDYEGDVEQLIADDIDQILWDIDRNVDVYNTDGISEVLWNAVNEGGIDIEQLKANINNLYLEDSNGNMVGNEVTRQIIESLGYDGIVDNTVSTKFNMNLDAGTTHYIVFKPNQIKSINNQNPTDNPDIRFSLSDIAPANREPIISKLTGREISKQAYSALDRLGRGETVALEELDALPEVIEGKAKVKEYRNEFLSAHPELKDVSSDKLGTHLIDSAEREQLRETILQERLKSGSFTGIDKNKKELYNGGVEKGKRLDIVIGLPAAGKSTSIVNPISQYHKSVVVDSDIIKGKLPEFNDGWGATLVHEESSEINMQMLGEELALGNNIVLPIVGSKTSSVEKYLKLAKEKGYEVHLHLNELNSSKAMGRMVRRYFNDGRFIPPSVSWKYGDLPTTVYEEMKNRGDISGYSHWNNDVAKGQRPILTGISRNNQLYGEYSNSWRAVRESDVGQDVGESSTREYANSGNGVGGLQAPMVEDAPTRENSERSTGLSPLVRLSLSPVTLNPKTQEALSRSGVVSLELIDSSDDSNAFSIALSEARASDERNGWAVTPKTAEELVNENIRTIMTIDNKAGLGVKPDGDIVAVFKNKNGGQPRVLNTLIPAALEMGGNKLDCYGEGLVDLYARYGFIPVARVSFNENYANDGWTPDKGEPEIFFMIHNGDSADVVAANIGKYKEWTTEELNALPLYGKEDYYEAETYRNNLIEQNIAPVKNSLSPVGEQPSSVGTPMSDLYLDIAPVKEAVAETTDEIPMPTDADVPFPDEIAPMTEEEANAIQSEKVNAHSKTSLEAVQTELANVKELRSEAYASYEQKIAKKQAELKAKKNKDTKVANSLRMQIERMKRLRDSTDAEYSKRISTLETRERLVREGKPTTREEHYNNIVNDVKATFSSSGYDFDDVLENARNLSTFSTVDNIPQRVMEKALGYKEGQVLADLTVNKVAQNETEGIKWLNSFTDRKNGTLAELSKKYKIKPGSKESAAAQMYAEGFYVNDNNDIVEYGDAELAQDFPNEDVRNNIKGLAQDPRIRQIYDETLAAINESRTRNAYPEIQKLDNYFLHFRAMDDTFSKLGLPFNPNDIRAKDLPTDLNGVTADLKPGQPYFSSAMHRKGKRTSFDLLGGLERYLTSAKNQIYHIDDIQTLRALRNYIADTYGQANGLEGIDALTEEEAQERIEKVYGSHLSTFAKFLNEEANVLAGKTALIDRGLEGIIGRRGMTFLNTVKKQVGSNMVGFNISSSLTNFIPVAQTFAKTNKFDFIKAFAQTASNKFSSIFGKSDNFAENSPVIIRRKGSDRFYRTPFQKVGDAGYVLMSAVDDISTELIARTKFNELTRKGMDEQTAHFETDKWVSRLMGDRSLGQMPQLYNSKMLGVVTQFQLEVRNQLDSQFYDTIQEAKVSNEEIENGLARNAKTAAKVTSTFVQLAVAQHLFGKAFESVAGYNPAFDIISVLATMFGFDDEEDSEDTVMDNVSQGFLELLEDLPYASTLLNGGRIPISSALPLTEVIKGEDSYGNEKSRLKILGEAAPYYVLPGGYGQIKKTAQGLGMFSDEHPIAGSYTDSGNLRFPVEDTLGNRIQAGIFGQYASQNAREYFDGGYAPLKEKQIQEYIDVDIPIKDYWKYREGLSGLKTLNEKGDYIGGLDLPVNKKNVLINNIADRDNPIDMTGYENYSDFEEFDFATRYPEKYAVLQDMGISVNEYKEKYEETAFMYTDDFSWAANNPEKYTVSKAVTSDVIKYKQYTTDLYNIKADKDSNGKSINGSRKEKVIDYVNNLDIDYGARLVLFKSEYPSDDTYNMDIINYLNEREDLTYDDRVTILTELGFKVVDGQIYWD